MASNDGKVILPQQHVKKGRGVPGYKGENIDVVDADGKVVGHGDTGDTKTKSATKGDK